MTKFAHLPNMHLLATARLFENGIVAGHVPAYVVSLLATTCLSELTIRGIATTGYCGRIDIGTWGRLQKWKWKPTLALMYPNRCFFAAASVRHFIGGKYFS